MQIMGINNNKTMDINNNETRTVQLSLNNNLSNNRLIGKIKMQCHINKSNSNNRMVMDKMDIIKIDLLEMVWSHHLLMVTNSNNMDNMDNKNLCQHRHHQIKKWP